MKKLTILLILISLWTKAQEYPKSRIRDTYFAVATTLGTGILTDKLLKTGSKSRNHLISFTVAAAIPITTGILLKNKDFVWGGLVGSFTLIVPFTFNPKKHRHEHNK